MTSLEKINYMIQSLQLARDEIEYAQSYLEAKEKDRFLRDYGHVWCYKRMPNGTFIRESIKQVGRMANTVAKDITLTRWCDQIFK